MGYEGDEHDDESLGDSPDDEGRDHPRAALPDPLDRLWLHPSELSPLIGAPMIGASAIAGSASTIPRPRPMWSTTLVAGAVGAVLTLAVLGVIGALGSASDRATPREVVPTSAPMASAPAIAIAVGPSVVAVSARDQSGTRRGSGVCVRRANEILTSDRLVGSSSKVNVTTSDGVVHAARILGRDATTDLVLLRLDTGLPTVAPSARVARAGDTVWVVGAPSPGDKTPWISGGMVASTDSIVALDRGPTTSGLLETGAASGAASSGGALIDAAGLVTGIVLAPVGDSRTTYALPIATALTIADDLRSQGYTTHGALGINGIDKPAGPTVTALVAGGPAARAGVHVGDIVERVDNHEVGSIEDVMAIVRHNTPGRAIVIELVRGSRKVAVTATLTGMVPH
jgi:S1-C subfamily serine protease